MFLTAENTNKNDDEFTFCQMAMTAPNAVERKACWDARDLLWKCLDDNNDKVASCQSFQGEFESKCPAQWVNYPPYFVVIVHNIGSVFLITAFPYRSSISVKGETS